MPKQPAFPGLKHAMKKKLTRREQFLSEMDKVVPWQRLLGLIAPQYPKAGPKGGRPPNGPCRSSSRRTSRVLISTQR